MPKRKASKNGAQRRSLPVQPLTSPSKAVKSKYPVLEDFYAYDWKNVPLRHAFGAYALCLYANLPDYFDVATEALTEGGDDKDCDLCFIDVEAGAAFIVQATANDLWDKPTAKTNKADDLLTAVSWLLKKPYASIPEGLRAKAVELQEALARKEIKQIYLLFVHNCEQSKDVENALDTVSTSSKTLLGDADVKVAAVEIGLPRLQHLYDSLNKQIVVDKKVTFEVTGHLQEKGDGWEAIQTTIDGGMLHDLWTDHQDDLFSANIRGFLNMLSRKTSVNRGILGTVTSVPKRFWAFNNGVTILTKGITANGNRIVAHGVSVINGAQTTGVLGNAPREHAAACRVPCRFIKCGDPDLVDEIIENNNTQNAIKAFDIRSNDQIQRRLETEFAATQIKYLHRRQGAQRLNEAAVQAEALAPVLAAFHGKFQVAIRQRRSILEDRSLYGDVFPPEISAQHVLLVQSLAVAINDYKTELMGGRRASTLNEQEEALHSFLQFSTAKLFVLGVFGRIAPQIAGRPLPDLFMWKVAAAHFKKTWRNNLVNRWRTLVEALIPLIVSQIEFNVENGPDVVRSTQELEKIAKRVGFQIQ